MKASRFRSLHRASVALASAVLATSAACAGSNDITIAPSSTGSPSSQVGDAPAPLETGRLPALAKPTHYGLELEIDPKSDHMSGKALISIEIPSPTDVIVLHARDLQFESAVMIERGESSTVTLTPRSSVKNIGSPDELVVSLPRKIDGHVDLVIRYRAPFTDQLSGAYKTTSGNDAYVFTQFEPMDARRAMPCFDEPGFKVPFDVSITVPAGDLALANASEVSRTPSSDQKSVTFKFATTKPLPTYLVAFAVGPFDVLEAKDSRVPLRVITVKGKTALGKVALDATRSFVDILEKYFGVPYPYDKLDLLAVPDFAAGAMENAGLITFREELILTDADHMPASAARHIGLTIAHELAHHWFGDLVTMAWWDDLWLNEGFATWIETKVVDQWRPELGADLGSVADRTDAMEVDARASVRAIRRDVRSSSDANEAFDAIIYDKGAAVIGMLEHWLGPETFQAGVQQYLKSHAYGSATASDLFAALSEASKKDVGAVASTFFDKPGVPLVTVDLDCKTNPKAPRIHLSEERFVLRTKPATSPAEKDWKIPVCLDYDGNGGAPLCTLLDGEGTLDVAGGKCPKWIAPDVDERGYYRYALPADLFRSLAKADLSARTRFGVLDNAGALVEGGKLGADVLFDLVDAMKPVQGGKLDSNRGVMAEKILAVLSDMATLVDASDRPAFSKLVARTMLPLAKDIGWDAKKGESDDVRLLRRNVLLGLAPLVDDDPWIAEQTNAHLKALLADPTSLDADVATAAMIFAAKKGDAALFDKLVGLLAKKPSPQLRSGILLALGSFGDPKLLGRSLDLLLAGGTDDGGIKKQDSTYLFRAAGWFPASRPVLLAWYAKHVSELEANLPDVLFVGTIEELQFCDPASLASAHTIFDGKLSKIEGGDDAAARLYERAELCIAEKDREKTHLSARLRSGK